MKLTLSLIVFSLLIFSMINVTMAAESLGTFKQHECIQLIQTCSNCTFVNISSVTSPSSSKLIQEVSMLKTGTSYNYTFCDTDLLGSYRVDGYGDLDGKYQVFAYNFIITPSGGNENNTTFFIILIIIAVVFLLLAFIFKNYIIATISGFVFLGTGVYGMIYGFGNITNLYTQIISLIIIGLGAIITITSALDYIGEAESGYSSASWINEGDDD